MGAQMGGRGSAPPIFRLINQGVNSFDHNPTDFAAID